MNINIQRKIYHLRKKYIDNPNANEQLNKIIWYSFPIVYPIENLHKKMSNALRNANDRYYRALNYARDMSLCKAFDYVLITLTFSNESLNYQSESTRKLYVSQYLNYHCVDYIACVDYGLKNNREHYHAIALVEPMALYLDSNGKYKFYDDWNGGFHLVSLINNRSDAAIAYAMKAVRYAFKSGGKVFHKRKPYKSKLVFNYTHDWEELESEEVLLCGLV